MLFGLSLRPGPPSWADGGVLGRHAFQHPVPARVPVVLASDDLTIPVRLVPLTDWGHSLFPLQGLGHRGAEPDKGPEIRERFGPGTSSEGFEDTDREYYYERSPRSSDRCSRIPGSLEELGREKFGEAGEATPQSRRSEAGSKGHVRRGGPAAGEEGPGGAPAGRPTVSRRRPPRDPPEAEPGDGRRRRGRRPDAGAQAELRPKPPEKPSAASGSQPPLRRRHGPGLDPQDAGPSRGGRRLGRPGPQDGGSQEPRPLPPHCGAFGGARSGGE